MNIIVSSKVNSIEMDENIKSTSGLTKLSNNSNMKITRMLRKPIQILTTKCNEETWLVEVNKMVMNDIYKRKKSFWIKIMAYSN